MTPRNRGRWVTASADASLQKFCAIVADFCWKKWTNPCLFFVYLRAFQTTFCTEKTEDFSWIRTRNVEVEG